MNLAALTELERVARYSQIEQGLIPYWSHRPMSAVETRSKVDFAAIAAAYLDAYTAADRILTRLDRALLDDLAAAVPVGGEPVEVSAAVTRWTMALTRGAAAARLTAVTDLSQLLDSLAGVAGSLLRREVAMQGAAGGAALEFAGRNAARTRARNLIGRFEDQAGYAVEAAAAKLQQVLTAAGQYADRDSTLAAGEKAGHVAALDSARQAAHIAHGAGRADALEEMPEPAEIVASEILDDDTCGPCKRIDGRQYDSVKAGEVDYPAQGPYRQCLGGARCRGMLVVVFA